MGVRDSETRMVNYQLTGSMISISVAAPSKFLYLVFAAFVEMASVVL